MKYFAVGEEAEREVDSAISKETIEIDPDEGVDEDEEEEDEEDEKTVTVKVTVMVTTAPGGTAAEVEEALRDALLDENCTIDSFEIEQVATS